MSNIVIIGSGPAGVSAALYAARAGVQTTVLTKGPGALDRAELIQNYYGFAEPITGAELERRGIEGAKAVGVEFVTTEAVGLTYTDKLTVETLDGDYPADAVILATGAARAVPRIPGLAGLEGHGVSYCATCDGMFYRNKTVAVVGGGNTAVADVLYLSRLCQKVYLIHRRDELRASKVYLDPLQKAGNVEFVWDSQVQELLYGETVTGVRVKNKKTGQLREIPCDGVFVAVGHIPNTQLLRGQVELDEAGYVLAGETTKTNLPGVFAVGDLRKKPLRQVVTAASDGAVAAHFIEEYFSTTVKENG